MGFLLPLAYFLMGAFAFNRFTHLSLARSFSAFMIFAVLLLFLSGFVFSNVQIGLILLNICLLFFAIYSFCSFLINRKKYIKFDFNWESIVVPVFLFVSMYLIVYIIDYKRSFSMWDEWSHWGVMAKELIRLNDFYLSNSSILTVHRDYPPFLGLLEYLFFKTSLSSVYNEAYLFRALHLFLFSLMLLPLENFQLSKSYSSIFLFLALPLSIICIFSFGPCGQETVLSLYNDLPLAVLTAAGIYIALEPRPVDSASVLFLSMLLSAVLLTKQIGIAFFCLILFAFMLRVIDQHKKTSFNGIRFFFFKICFPVLLIPIGFDKLWKVKVSQSFTDSQFNISNINLFDLSNGLATGSFSQSYREQTLVNFKRAIFDTSFITYPFHCSYIASALILIALISLFTFFINRKRPIENRAQVPFLVAVFGLGLIGYSISMLLLYLYCFDSFESVNLASFNRYMGTYVSIEFIFTFMWVIDGLQCIKKDACSVSLDVLPIPLLLFVLFSSTSSLQKALDTNVSYMVPSTSHTAKELANYVSTKDKLYLVDQNGDGGALFQIAYYLNPVFTNTNVAFRFGNPSKSIYDVDCRGLSLDKYVSDFDYLYIENLNEEFSKRFSSLLRSSDSFVNKGLYKIRHIDGNLVLELVSVIK